MNTDESCLAANVLSKNCPSRVKLMHLTNRWGVLVMFCLRRGTHRFSELRRRIDGISEKMLTQTLRHLENDGFVIRKERQSIYESWDIETAKTLLRELEITIQILEENNDKEI